MRRTTPVGIGTAGTTRRGTRASSRRYDGKPPGYVGNGVPDAGKQDPFAYESVGERDVTSRLAPGMRRLGMGGGLEADVVRGWTFLLMTMDCVLNFLVAAVIGIICIV